MTTLITHNNVQKHTKYDSKILNQAMSVICFQPTVAIVSPYTFIFPFKKGCCKPDWPFDGLFFSLTFVIVAVFPTPQLT